MLELAKVYKKNFYVYVSSDKRYEYTVSVQSEPEKKSRLVVVTIYDHKYLGDPNHQLQSCTAYICYNYSVDSMLRHCQYLFDEIGLFRNGISCYTDLLCLAKEK